MSIKAVIYDLEIDILKIHYDPIILKLKKDTHLSINKIRSLFFSPYFYFFTIGKLNFESFVRTSFDELMLENSYITKLENRYKKSFDYNIAKKENLIYICELFNLEIFFSADLDASISLSLIKKDPSLSKISFFSSRLKSAKQETYFLEKVLKEINLEPCHILIVDDNIEVLKNAKDKGFITLFYDGKRDFYQLLKLVFESYDKEIID